MDVEAKKPKCNYNLICYNLSEYWKSVVLEDLDCDFLLEFQNKLQNEISSKTVYPNREFFWRCLSKFDSVNNIDVVIVGQDPYHDGHAEGYCFETKKEPLPPSLRNIYKEIRDEFPDIDKQPSLKKPGVLLLNRVLSVVSKKPASHAKLGWTKLTDNLIRKISKECNNVVFILWGNLAAKVYPLIDAKRHLILMSNHPSPFSVSRFIGCNHFKITNEYLTKIGKKPIDWFN